MSTEPPPGSGGTPEDDPFRKQPPPHGDTPGGGAPQGGNPYGPGPEGGGNPYGDPPGGGPYGGGSPGAGGPYGGGQGGGFGGSQGGGFGGGGPRGGGSYGNGPYGNDPYGGGGPGDPLAGMPPLADSGKRTLARIIDLILVGIVVWLVTWPIGVHEYNVSGNNVAFGRSFAQSLIAAVLYTGYDTVMISRTGQTLGKKWLKMRVANLDNGATPSVQTTLIRSLVLWIPFAFCCACIWTAIAGGWSFFDRPYKQGLHDKAAKTVVVSTA
ncbi:RDD family protein [Streptomyces griseoviridis]|uniref:RDD family protein n=1 Tax=Streptomyces griseoviridis TaxID=45398 RepID=A0A3S9ZGZ2_STRGD|nr:RDD family protein [Streptomyces griseoviridis]AZS86968.1 RDD family protein [Streptomyces griseoviridis]QCN86177.1 RDD family protein [Streptomyces griseoviridis]